MRIPRGDYSAAATAVHDRSLRQRASRYKSSAGALWLLYEKQERCCAVCRHPAPMSDLVVDHNHGTGAVRGLLCSRCNSALGLLGDNPQIVSRAAAYLDKTSHSASRRMGSGLPLSRDEATVLIQNLQRIDYGHSIAKDGADTPSVTAREHRVAHRLLPAAGLSICPLNPCSVPTPQEAPA